MAARSNLPIVLGVDTATLEGRTLRWAAEQAHLEGRRLQLVTAAGPVSPGQRDHGRGSLLVSSTRLNLRGGAVLDWAREELRLTAPYVEVDQMFQVADPSTLLIQLASSAHLVVLGSRGRGSLRGHVLGSVALAVVRHAACPVVVHRPVYPGQAHRGVVVGRRGHGGLHARAGLRLPPSEPSASATQGRPLRVRRAVGTGRRSHGR